MKSIAKANGRNLDGMLYSTFRTPYRVHSQAKEKIENKPVCGSKRRIKHAYLSFFHSPLQYFSLLN